MENIEIGYFFSRKQYLKQYICSNFANIMELFDLSYLQKIINQIFLVKKYVITEIIVNKVKIVSLTFASYDVLI